MLNMKFTNTLIFLTTLAVVTSALAEGIRVNIFNKSFSLPTNCEFYAHPAIKGDIRFNCNYWNPVDGVVIYFQTKEYCSKHYFKHKPYDSETVIRRESYQIDDMQYLDYISSYDNKKPIIARIIMNYEDCVYALGSNEKNLDELLGGIWQKSITSQPSGR